MVLWTIQPESVLRQIMKDGYYKLDPRKAGFRKDFSEAYGWMENEMHKRGINPEVHDGAKEPLVWAWFTYDGKHDAPEFLDETFDDGDRTCLLEIAVSGNRVLLSDFDAWHGVLNKWLLDDSNNEEEWEAIHADFDRLHFGEQERRKEESWQKIFDVEKYDSGNGWRTNGNYVQATFYGLYKAQIKRAYIGENGNARELNVCADQLEGGRRVSEESVTSL